MITVANPIYDVVFKYLMEDKRIARTILSALLKEDIIEVEMRPHEYVNDKRDSVSILRIDFGARVRQADGSEHLILIELQKTWLETETLRFRQYLGVQYDNPDNMLEGGVNALPMVAVYLLGHQVGDIDEPVLYVKHESYDYNGKLVTKGLPNPFVDSLTHDSIIVQIPLLRGKLSDGQHGHSRLEKVLSIFDQSNKDGQNRKVLNIDDSFYSGDADMEHIVQRLAMAAGDSKLRQDMNIEEEFISVIERRDTEILHRDYELAKQKVILDKQKVILDEQKVILDEQKSQIDEQKSQIDEQKSQIDEQKVILDEQKSQIDEQKVILNEQKVILDEQRSQIEQKDASLKKSIQLLRSANLSVEDIASSLGMDINEVRLLIE
ncbi:MAG: hypothetical protein J6M94_07165 [Prevotella sp.]|nr:hypothetical protein [Prevotella sp.]